MSFIIGVMPLFDEHKNSIWMLPAYLEMLERHKLVPLIFPYTTNKLVLEKLIKQVDGLLFTGGHDVNPALYDEQKLDVCGNTLVIRDELEKYVFERAVERDIPMLGICRGLQLFNVLYGGTLYQDLPTQFNTTLNHTQKPPYDVPVHRITFTEDSLFGKALGLTDYEVNSFHHQAIKDLAPNTTVLAMSEDGLVEAIQLKPLSFAVAVQWHPEYLAKEDKLTAFLVNELFEACVDYNYVKNK